LSFLKKILLSIISIFLGTVFERKLYSIFSSIFDRYFSICL